MNSIKALIKVVGVVFGTLSIYSVYILGYFILTLFRQETVPWLNRCLQFWGSVIAGMLSIRVQVEGEIPEPPFFLVSNHLSYVDIIILLKTLKTTFVAKKEVAGWPFLGFISKSIGVVFIDRKRRQDVSRVNEEISASVSDKRGLTLFPEGTTSPGASVLRFRASLLEFPAQSNLGAHYCAINYSIESGDAEAYNTVCWWGNAPIHKHMYNLAKKSNVKATITFGSSKINESDRKILSEELHQKVSELFNPMCKADDTLYEPADF